MQIFKREKCNEFQLIYSFLVNQRIADLKCYVIDNQQLINRVQK